MDALNKQREIIFCSCRVEVLQILGYPKAKSALMRWKFAQIRIVIASLSFSFLNYDYTGLFPPPENRPDEFFE